MMQNGAITVCAEGLIDPNMTIQVLGNKLTAAQLCDVIRAFLDSDDATHWGAFEKELDDVVTRHGTFE